MKGIEIIILTIVFSCIASSAKGRNINETKEGQFDKQFVDYLNNKDKNKNKVKKIYYRFISPKDSIPNLIIQHCLNMNKKRQCYDVILLSVNYNTEGYAVCELDFCFKKQIDNLQMRGYLDKFGYYQYGKWQVFVSGNAAKHFFFRNRTNKKQLLNYKVEHPMMERLYNPQFNPKYVIRKDKIIVKYDNIFNDVNSYLDDVNTVILNNLGLNRENVIYDTNGLYDFSQCSFFHLINHNYQSELQYSRNEDLIQIEHFDSRNLLERPKDNKIRIYATPDLGEYIGVLILKDTKPIFLVLEQDKGELKIVQSIDVD